MSETPRRFSAMEIEELREALAATNTLGVTLTQIDTLCDMALALSAAEQRAEAMGKDAARYRFLRDGNAYHAIIDSPTEKTLSGKPIKIGAYGKQPASGKDLDAAIDAALSTNKEVT